MTSMSFFSVSFLLFLSLFISFVHTTPRWHPNSSEERWSVILSRGAKLPHKLLVEGGWKISGHPHRSLNTTHFILSRPKKARFHEQDEDKQQRHLPSTWPGVVSSKLLVPHRRHHRDIIDDASREPLWAKQWHLHPFNWPTAASTPYMPAHISAVEAWLAGATGQGVQVAVVDDGLQAKHPDLHSQYDAAGSYDFNYDKPDVEPTSYDAHGTEAAGTAAAGINAVCGSGVAPSARLAGIRLLAEASVTDEQEALALSYEDQRNHVYSNSWGPYDDGMRLEGPGELTRAAMKQAIIEGRGGRGSIYVWAAGNGKMANDNCNFDGYANNRYTITVPAVTSLGYSSPYSEECSANIVCAPSSGGYDNPYKIVTTDLLGPAGVSSTDCSTTFGGTSAAAPIVAGVVALMLSVRPELGWRDVQGVLIHSADAIDSTNAATWQTNGAGLRYSHAYGFGRVNASHAVELARTWTLYPPEVEISSENTSFSGASSSSVITVAQDIRVQAVAVTFSTRVARRGRLSIQLTSPSGTVSRLSPYHPDATADIHEWTYGSVANWDESSIGDWTLALTADTQAGQWQEASWRLHVYGYVEGGDGGGDNGSGDNNGGGDNEEDAP